MVRPKKQKTMAKEKPEAKVMPAATPESSSVRVGSLNVNSVFKYAGDEWIVTSAQSDKVLIRKIKDGVNGTVDPGLVVEL